MQSIHLRQLIAIIAFLSLFGCHRPTLTNANGINPNIKIAEDSTSSVSDRINASLRLNYQERKGLITVLLARASKNYDQKTVEDLSVLAQIGDENVAKQIEHFNDADKKLGIDTPGPIRNEREYAIERIRKRIARPVPK